MKRRKGLLLFVSLVLVGLFLFEDPFGWTSNEPVVQGKTVTEWLDSMPLYSDFREMDETGQNVFTNRTPELIDSDSSIKAILKLGATAVPILKKRITEEPIPPDLPLIRQVLLKLETLRDRLFQKAGAAAVKQSYVDYSSRQQARIQAASFTLLMLGKSNGGGFSNLVMASANSSTNVKNMALSRAALVLRDASRSFSGKRQEILSEITFGLESSNLHYQIGAIQSTRAFPGEMPQWKPKLIQLTSASEGRVRLAALWALATTHADDEEVIQLEISILQNTNNSALIRAYAASGLGLAGAKANHTIPHLQLAMKDKDRFLHSSARRAIQSIERAKLSGAGQ